MRKRILKANELLKRELNQIFLKDIDFSAQALVTITRVENSVDLKESRVFISVIPEEKIPEVLRILNSQIYTIQQKINKRLRMRPIPKIIFKVEKITAAADRVEKLLEEIKKN